MDTDAAPEAVSALHMKDEWMHAITEDYLEDLFETGKSLMHKLNSAN